MEALFNKLESLLLPLATKIGSQKHMLAIRDAFSSISAILIIGSIASLINNFPMPVFQDFMLRTFGEIWKLPGNSIYNMTMGILSLFVVMSLGYYLAKFYEIDGISSGIIALATFLILTPLTEDGSGISLNWLGAKGLFVAMLVGILSTEIYRFVVKKNWVIRMPEGVPPAVSSGFIALVPSLIIFLVAGILAAVLQASFQLSLHEVIYQTLQAPFQKIGDTIWAMCFLLFARGFLWFFGIHGTNVLGPISDSILLPNIEENARAFASGVSAYDVPKIATSSFVSQFVSIGGTGVGLAFILAVFIVSKQKATRDISLGAAPGVLFNINEPIMYGIPIVLNPVLAIPFLLTPLVLIVVSYLAMSVGIVPKTVALVPWNMPIIIGGFLATGGSVLGAILQVVNVAIATLIYMPFIKVNDQAMDKIAQKENRLVEGEEN